MSAATSEEPWLDSAAACLHLSISKPTLQRWLKKPDLKKKMNPSRTPSGEYRFKRENLDSVLDPVETVKKGGGQ